MVVLGSPLFIYKVIYLIMVTGPMCRLKFFAVLFVFYPSNCLIVKRCDTEGWCFVFGVLCKCVGW
jgi:hypothetical protein